jgi:hypothetical protein
MGWAAGLHPGIGAGRAVTGFQPAAACRAPMPSPLARSALLRQALMLSVIAVLAAPAATPAAGLARLSFPAGAAVVAGWLALRGRLAAS